MAAPLSSAHADTSAALSLTGAVGQWPGGCDGEASRARLQRACGDALGSVLAIRWTLALAVDNIEALTALQASCVRHGGFVAGAQRFDAHAFGISPAEAGAMDPQQRLLLELGYASLHGSYQRRTTLMGGDGGVFVGIERPDWVVAQPPSARLSNVLH